MKKTRISDFWLYKFRYQIAYGTLFLAYLAIIFYTIFIAPNGLTSAEIESAKSSANINFANIFSGEIINLPFRLLQNLSISIFGLSNFSIKLPAILISIATVFAVIKLSHTWFSKGTATLAAILAIASGQFFFIAQNGTAEILYIFYPILLIWLGAKFLETKKKRTLLPLATVLALSFYTPLSIYIVLAFGLTILAHPHLRFALNREIEKKKRIIAVATFGVILLPLAIAVVRDFSIIKTIFGVPNSLNIFENIGVLISNLFSFSSKKFWWRNFANYQSASFDFDRDRFIFHIQRKTHRKKLSCQHLADNSFTRMRNQPESNRDTFHADFDFDDHRTPKPDPNLVYDFPAKPLRARAWADSDFVFCN